MTHDHGIQLNDRVVELSANHREPMRNLFIDLMLCPVEWLKSSRFQLRVMFVETLGPILRGVRTSLSSAGLWKVDDRWHAITHAKCRSILTGAG